jgi:hypothetical protein
MSDLDALFDSESEEEEDVMPKARPKALPASSGEEDGAGGRDKLPVNSARLMRHDDEDEDEDDEEGVGRFGQPQDNR